MAPLLVLYKWIPDTVHFGMQLQYFLRHLKKKNDQLKLNKYIKCKFISNEKPKFGPKLVAPYLVTA